MTYDKKNINNMQSPEAIRTKEDAETGETISIKKGRVESVSIYEVSESELAILENGSSKELYFNFFIFFITIFISFLVSLSTVDFDNKIITRNVFIFITIISGFLMIILLCFWLRGKNQFKDVIKKIKDRIS